MATANPFKELEPDVVCPPHIKTAIVSEIDLIRNTIMIIDLYVGDLFNVASALVEALSPTSSTKKTGP